MESLASLRGYLRHKRIFYKPDLLYYCILSNNTLSLYENDAIEHPTTDENSEQPKNPSIKPIRSIPMSDIQYVHSVCTSKFFTNPLPRFQITLNKGPPLVFECTSSEIMEKWMCALRAEQPNLRLSIDSFHLLKVIGKGASGKVYLARKKYSNQLSTSQRTEQIPAQRAASSFGHTYSITEELPNADETLFNSVGSEPCSNDNESNLLPQLFAIKAIRKDKLNQASKLIHVIAERNILMSVSHQFITRLYYSFQSPYKLYFVLEYIAGGDLRHHLNKQIEFSAYQIRLFLAEIIVALRTLHLYGIIYRDLKPENILIDLDGHIKLTDFGLATTTSNENSHSTMCGTYEYLPPEMLHEKKQQTYAIDYWSLGVLAYRLIVKRLPFRNQNMNKLFDAIASKEPLFPKSICEEQPHAVSFIQGLLQKDPTKRLGSFDNDITQHKYFEGIDWNRVARKQYEPDFKPYLCHPESVSNFDEIFTSEEPKESFINPNEDDTSSSFYDEEMKLFDMHEYGTCEESASEPVESLSSGDPQRTEAPSGVDSSIAKKLFDNFSLNNENSPLLKSVVSFEDLNSLNTAD